MSFAEQLITGWPAGKVEADPGLDAQLIARCLGGDEVAHTLLYERYAGYLYRLAYGLLQQQEDAEEVLQDSFEYAFRKLAHYDPEKASFKTWLYQIAVSRCRNKRRRKWLPTLPLEPGLGERLADTAAATPDEKLLLSGRQQQIWTALQALSPKLRETAVLRYYEELSYKEIGQILEIPAKTAESRMRLAHKALREILEEGSNGS